MFRAEFVDPRTSSEASTRSDEMEVDNMRKETRHQIDSLVATSKKAWTTMPTVKVLRAFEMRRDIAREMLRNRWQRSLPHRELVPRARAAAAPTGSTPTPPTPTSARAWDFLQTPGNSGNRAAQRGGATAT